MNDLTTEILNFLEKHAKAAASYDPEMDEPEEKFNGPDSAMLHATAISIDADKDIIAPLSSYGSGCYHPINDDAAREWHDKIIDKISLHIGMQNRPNNR